MEFAPFACVEGAREGMTNKAAIGSLDADLRTTCDRRIEQVTSSWEPSFPPPPIFKRVKTPNAKSRAVTRLMSNLLPLEQTRAQLKASALADRSPAPEPGILQCYRLIDY